jgi:hypothetical protein
MPRALQLAEPEGPGPSLICMTRPGPKGRELSHSARLLASCIADHNQRTGFGLLALANVIFKSLNRGSSVGRARAFP